MMTHSARRTQLTIIHRLDRFDMGNGLNMDDAFDMDDRFDMDDGFDMDDRFDMGDRFDRNADRKRIWLILCILKAPANVFKGSPL